jgi:hypothetical protein
MKQSEALDLLSFEFFREFARCEYCLKVAGLREPNRRDPTADWGALSEQISTTLDQPSSAELQLAVRYYLASPPKKQVLIEDHLDWSNNLPDHKSQSELLLRLVCRVRNNLFHGGKFNGHWFEPQRSELLLQHGLVILKAVVNAHPLVRAAYENKAA